VVGRDRTCAVRLSDPLVSKQHARVTIADVVEIADLGAANGVYLGDRKVDRVRLHPGDQVLLGDSLVRVTARPARTPGVEHVRPALVRPRYAGVDVDAPLPPRRVPRRRLPVLAVVIPVTVGVGLYIVTRSPYALLLVGLGPLAAAVAYAEDAWSSRNGYAAAVAAYRTALATLDARLSTAAAAERAGRRAEYPSTADLVAAAHRLDPLLWSRRPDRDDFLQLCLGLGGRPSRNRVRMTAATDPFAWNELRQIVATHTTVDGVPVTARLPDVGTVGVAGHGGSGVPVAVGLVAQLVTLHAPADLLVAAVVSPASAPAWQWLAWLPHASGAFAAHLTAGGEQSAGLLAELEALVDRRSGGAPPLPAVVLVVTDDAAAERARLVEMAARGPRHGVYVIWVAPVVERLPAVCGAYVDARSTTDGGAIGFPRPGELIEPVVVEPLAPGAAEDLGRRLAPIVDADAPTRRPTATPLTIRTLTFGPGEVWPEPVSETWADTQRVPTG
jgi:S-DNA-T family DNA segregation ATPase FtsK/SpoIIIE